jgi:aldehyde dehydrogenase (NAD+)
MSRLLVQSSIAPAFIERVKSNFVKASSLTGFDPLAPTTYYGPMADSAHFNRVMSFIENGKNSTEVSTGAERKGQKGYFVEPTVFLNPSEDNPLFTDEIFGPVMVINTFDTVEEALRIANNSITGLAGEDYIASSRFFDLDRTGAHCRTNSFTLYFGSHART